MISAVVALGVVAGMVLFMCLFIALAHKHSGTGMPPPWRPRARADWKRQYLARHSEAMRLDRLARAGNGQANRSAPVIVVSLVTVLLFAGLTVLFIVKLR